MQVVQTIEQTSKGWKALIALGVVAIMVGLGGCLVDWANTYTALSLDHSVNTEPRWWPVILVIGFAVYVLSRIGAWWDHG